MGAACNPLCEKSLDKSQLQQIFKKQSTGKLLGLTAQQRSKYWSKIMQLNFRQGFPNQFVPDVSRQEGFIYCPKKYFYEGRTKNAIPHVKGRLTLLGINITVQGWFREGRAEGQCSVLSEGMHAQGRWHEGLPHQLRVRNNNQEYFIDFNLPSLSKGKIIYPNGNVYCGQFRFDFQQKIHIIEGKGVLTYSNGNTLKGNFLDGYLEGQGVFESKSQQCIYRGNFRRSQFQGEGILQMQKGVLKINWKQNKPHGKGEFISNGNSAQICYENGVRQLTLISRVDIDS